MKIIEIDKNKYSFNKIKAIKGESAKINLDSNLSNSDFTVIDTTIENPIITKYCGNLIVLISNTDNALLKGTPVYLMSKYSLKKTDINVITEIQPIRAERRNFSRDRIVANQYIPVDDATIKQSRQRSRYWVYICFPWKG